MEYELASSPFEAILTRPVSQFPFNIMDKKESPPRWTREGASAADAVSAWWGPFTRLVAKEHGR